MATIESSGKFNHPESDSTEQMLLKLIELNPEIASAHANLGRHYAQNGYFEKAIGHYKEALRLQPNNDAIQRSLARAKMQLEKEENHQKNYIQQQEIKLSSENISNNTSKKTEQDRFLGRLDIFKDNKLTGWLIDQKHLDQPCHLDIFINDIFYRKILANRWRDDLYKSFGYGNHGFLLEIPYIPNNRDNVEITATPIEDSNCIIGRSSKATPLVIQNFQPLPGWEPSFPLATQLQLPKNSGEDIENSNTKIAIAIPIYNAREAVSNCLASVFKYTKIVSKFILIDDASTDPELISILKSYEETVPNLILHRNEKNLGYTASINKAIELAGNDDVVLLNSDTIVTPRWLENLQIAAYSEADISTVTPLSNNAGAFSVPKDRTVNPIPSWLDQESFARLVTQESLVLYPEIPTGNGFCMYIRRDALDDLGMFDEDAFPRGYGEENDFCLRALTRGWRNIIDDRTLIYHLRSASFGKQKDQFAKSGRKIIDRRYPEYAKAVRTAFTDSPVMTTLRFHLEQNLHHYTRFPLPRVLYVISSKRGGTPQTNQDLMNEIAETYEPFLLTSNTKHLRLYDCRGKEQELLEEFHLSTELTASTHESAEYNKFLEYIFIRYGIELLHIRHIGRHSLSLPRIAKKLNIPVLFSFHDYYTITPNVKLLDYGKQYCIERFTTQEAKTKVELWSPETSPRLNENWRKRWQERMLNMLTLCDAFVTTSQYAKQILESNFPFLKNCDFRVISHGRNFSKMMQLGCAPNPDEPIRILVPGNLCVPKGSILLQEIKACDQKNKIEFHFLGDPDSSLDNIGIQHGTYERSEFLEIAANIQPHMGGVFSIWPETYSHTLTELWAAGLPVIGLPVGAVEERLQKHGGGWIIQNMEPEQIYKNITEVYSNSEEYREKLNSVLAWQQGEGNHYTTKAMTQEYIKLYQSVEHHSRSIATQEKIDDTARRHQQIIQLLGNDDELALPHDRKAVRKWFLEKQPNTELVWQRCTLDAFLDGNIRFEISSNDIVAVSIYEISPDKVEQFLEICRSIGLNFICLLEQHKAYQQQVTAVSETTETNEQFKRAIQGRKPLLANAHVVLTIGTNSWVDQIGKYLSQREIDVWQYRVESDPSWTDTAQRLFVYGADRIDWLQAIKAAQGRIRNQVSIVIPVYGKQDFTRRCIESIFRSTNSNISFEVIIVNNGSPDNTASMVRDMQQVYPNLQLLSSQENLMFSLGCDLGVIASKGEYIVLLNNDTEVSENWLSSLIEPLRQNPVIGMTGPKLVYPDETLQAGGIVFSDKSNFPYHIYQKMPSNSKIVNKQRYFQALTGACIAMRAVDFLAVKGLDPAFVNGSEDLDLCFKVRTQLHKKLLYCPSSTITHFEGKTPGRGGHRLQNRKIFVNRWRNKIKADDLSFYNEDGFYVEKYLTEKEEVMGNELVSIKPKLIEHP